MSFLRTMIEIKWPLLLMEFIFLVGGILLIISGFKIWKKSKLSAGVSIVVGFIITIVLSWVLFWTLIFGYNS